MTKVSKSKRIAGQLSEPQQRLVCEMADGACLIAWGRGWTVVRPREENRRTTNPPVLALYRFDLIKCGEPDYIVRITPLGLHVAKALSA